MGIQRVGVISDTHLARPIPELGDLLEGPFRDVDVILHAGDITELAVLEAFGGKEIIAVAGNMDSSCVRERLPGKKIWKTGKYRIGLIHGWGGKWGIEERIRREFEDIDCLVYGHTHLSAARREDGIYYFNPGSFSGLFGSGKKSVGVLELGDEISGRIYSL